MPTSSQDRLWASLLIIGAGILLVRTLAMVAADALEILVAWAAGLLVLEMVIDLVTLSAAVRWWISQRPRHGTVTLRYAAVAVLLHAARVLVFVLGRTPALADFDVRPEYQAAHAQTWSWAGVYLAATLSALAVVGMLVVWSMRRRSP